MIRKKTLLGFLALLAVAVSCADVPATSAQTPSTATRSYATTSILTQAALGSSAVFTSPWVDAGAAGQKSLELSAYSDQAGSFIVQASDDTNNPNLTVTVACNPSNSTSCASGVYTVTAATAFSSGTIYIAKRFYRVVYTNGGVAQTAFELTATGSQMARNAVISLGSTPLPVNATVAFPTTQPVTCATPNCVVTVANATTAPFATWVPIAVASSIPLTVNTPAPCATPACSNVVYQGTTLWNVNTPAPCATPTCNSLVWQGTSPWVVNTPVPMITGSGTVTSPSSNTITLTGQSSCYVNVSANTGAVAFNSAASNSLSGAYNLTAGGYTASSIASGTAELLLNTAGLNSFQVHQVSGSSTYNYSCGSGVPFVPLAAPIAQSTGAPQAQQTTTPTNAYNYGFFGGSWYPIGVGVTPNGGQPLETIPCSGSVCVVPTSSPNASAGLAVLPVSHCANNAGTTNCQGVGPTQAAYVADMCEENPSFFRFSATSFSSLAQAVALSGTTTIYVCSVEGYVVGTSMTEVTLEDGTGTNCGTGNGFIGDIGIDAGSITQSALRAQGNPYAQTRAGRALCILAGGVTITGGVISGRYVQL